MNTIISSRHFEGTFTGISKLRPEPAKIILSLKYFRFKIIHNFGQASKLKDNEKRLFPGREYTGNEM